MSQNTPRSSEIALLSHMSRNPTICGADLAKGVEIGRFVYLSGLWEVQCACVCVWHTILL